MSSGILHRRLAALLVIGVGAAGMFDPPADGAAAPPGDTTLTRRFDPVSAVTMFTLDVGKTSGGTLVLASCPGAQVLRVDGPGRATVTDSPAGTTVSFPTKPAGTYRVVLAGDMPGLDVGRDPPVSCADATAADPTVATRGGTRLGPSIRIAKHP